jgi:FkbM family methyltransferase
MNFSGISNKSTVGKLLRQPLRLLPPTTHVRILQGRLRGKHWIAGSSIHGCWLGSYEKEKQKVFESIVRSGDVVFDIGANVGFYTLLASELVGPLGHVFAFEPVPRNIDLLHEHLRLNRVSNAVVVDAAASNANGEAYFDDANNNSTGRLAESGTRRVRTVMIDSLVLEGKMLPPNCLKIDVEGGEVLALAGAKAVLQTYRPKILLATHGREVHRQSCEFLQSLGYSLEALGQGDIIECDELLAC